MLQIILGSNPEERLEGASNMEHFRTLKYFTLLLIFELTFKNAMCISGADGSPSSTAAGTAAARLRIDNNAKAQLNQHEINWKSRKVNLINF